MTLVDEQVHVIQFANNQKILNNHIQESKRFSNKFPSSVLTGIFCKLGSVDDKRPV